MLDRARDTEADVVVASRFAPSGEVAGLTPARTSSEATLKVRSLVFE